MGRAEVAVVPAVEPAAEEPHQMAWEAAVVLRRLIENPEGAAWVWVPCEDRRSASRIVRPTAAAVRNKP